MVSRRFCRCFSIISLNITCLFVFLLVLIYYKRTICDRVGDSTKLRVSVMDEIQINKNNKNTRNKDQSRERFSIEASNSSVSHNHSDIVSVEIRRPKIILSWTNYFGGRNPPNFLFSCPDLTYKCVGHSERDRIGEADAILFHSQDIRTDISKIRSLPRNPNQGFIYYTLESPQSSAVKSGELPANFFNWTATYHWASDVQATYAARGWLKREEAEKKGIPFTTTILSPTEINKSRKRAIFGAISNCKTPAKRSQFIAKVIKHIPDTVIAGNCYRKRICPKGKKGNACFRRYSEDSYFLFALENSICNGYITEKYWERIHMNTVLISWSRSVFDKMNLPSKSMIFVDDYKSILEFTVHLKYLMANQTAYAEYFEWRKEYTPDVTEQMECGVCRKLLDEGEKAIKERRKMYSDAVSWFNSISECQPPLYFKMRWE